MTLPPRWERSPPSTSHTYPQHSPPQHTSSYNRSHRTTPRLNRKNPSYPTFLCAVGHGDPYGVPLRFESSIKQDIITIDYFLTSPCSNDPPAPLAEDVPNVCAAVKTHNTPAPAITTDAPDYSHDHATPIHDGTPNTHAAAEELNTSTPPTINDSHYNSHDPNVPIHEDASNARPAMNMKNTSVPPTSGNT